MGSVVTLFGSLIAEVIRAYRWSYAETGIVLSAPAFGFFLSSLSAGILSQRIGPKTVMIAGMIVLAIALFFFGHWPNVGLNVFLNFAVGIGLGTNESLTNFLVVRMETGGRSRLMNLMHSSWCVGAFIGPFALADIIHLGLDWRIAYPVISLTVAVITIILSRIKFPMLRSVASKSPGQTEIGTGASRGPGRIILLCATSIFVYVGVEKGMYGWISDFFARVLHSAPSVGTAMVGVYWFGQFLGRLFLAILYNGSRQQVVLLLLSCATIAGVLPLVLIHDPVMAMFLTILIGLANSGIFPIIVSLAGKYSATSRSIGFVTAAGGIGGFGFPLLVAAVSESYGIAVGFSTVVYIATALVLLAMIIAFEVKSTQSLPTYGGVS